ncbi:MAG: hypothetical protein KC619_21825 [Myxococcales bacterium]|nr:hypothetical protein [Myxococcales bacterium]
MAFHRAPSALLPLALTASLLAACDGAGGATDIDVQYHESTQRVRIVMSRELAGGETLFARLRRGDVGGLDCRTQIGGLAEAPRLDVSSPTFEGPTMMETDIASPYDSSAWLEMEPTPDMLASILEGRAIIDVCLMSGDSVVEQREFDAREAFDRRGVNGKFDGEEARIASTVAYAERCVDELGDIPFFPRVADGDFQTYNCLDSTPIPTTVTGTDGTVTYPTEQVSQCDAPQYIYSLCEPSAQGPEGERPDVNGPRVTSATNDQGTSWVLLCRKSQAEVGQYNDIAMIGHNPFTGQTCYFQNALYRNTDGLHVPHPADTVNSEASPQQASSLWEGIQGGVAGPGGTSNIECARCHSMDAFIHSPWIDGALDSHGDPVVPRMGIHPDFALGYNDAPYSIVNMDGQGWTIPQQLTSPEAAACTRCHRMANDRWAQSWIDRLAGEDASWTNITTEAYRSFEHTFWMPPDLDGLTEQTFWDSPYGQSIRFIQHCGDTPTDPACQWEDIPRNAEGQEGDLPAVTATGVELATQALIALGASIDDPSCPDGHCATRRCAECHSVSRNGLRRWLEATQHAWNTCGITEGAVDPDRRLLDFVNGADFQTLDEQVGLPSDTAQHIVDGKPFASVDALNAVEGVGPATLRQLGDYAAGDPAQLSAEDARRTIDCLRSDPNDPDSVFAAEHLGVLTTGVQYGYFRRLFRTAYGDDGWLIPYTRFKNRVSMPKGSHPSMSQQEYATILTWFRNGLNDLDAALPEPPPPSTCSDFVDGPAITTHVSNMGFEGWGALNADAGIRMFGCTDDNPLSCFTVGDYGDESGVWGNGVGTIRNLRQLGFRTSFWMRSSADGRFVGNGGSSGSGGRSTITDLLAGRDIGVQASYDPGFFPDNSGFIFQGATGGAGLCAQSVLEGMDDSIDFTETGCTTARGINLYQHVARGLSGGDYFVINSQFTSDSGRSAQTDPSAPWNASSTIKITPMIFDGTTYQPEEAVIVDSPYEGDSVLSPSGQLVASRLAGPEGRSLGYSVRRVNASRFGDSYRITLSDPIATLCTPGAKVSFSFDERFMVTHHHDGNRTNLQLYDLTTGMVHTITNMPDNMRAIFPHFRSDGWIYFLVMDNENNREFIAASNAALEIASR